MPHLYCVSVAAFPWASTAAWLATAWSYSTISQGTTCSSPLSASPSPTRRPVSSFSTNDPFPPEPFLTARVKLVSGCHYPQASLRSSFPFALRQGQASASLPLPHHVELSHRLTNGVAAGAQVAPHQPATSQPCSAPPLPHFSFLLDPRPPGPHHQRRPTPPRRRPFADAARTAPRYSQLCFFC